MSHGCYEIGPVDEKRMFPAAGGNVYAGRAHVEGPSAIVEGSGVIV
jgi:hypothetical protein